MRAITLSAVFLATVSLIPLGATNGEEAESVLRYQYEIEVPEMSDGEHILSVGAVAVAGSEVGPRGAACPDEPTLLNFTGGGAVACPCFVPTEQAGAVFNAPAAHYPIEILRVGIGWGSQFGGAPQSLEQAIHIYGTGLPNPGAPIFSLPGPTLTDGFVNVFDLEPLPGQIIVNAGPFSATLEFLNQNAGNVFAPSVVHDGNGCTPAQNLVLAQPGGWNDACLLGVTGDWVFNVVYRQVNCTPVCRSTCGDIDSSGGAVNLVDFASFAVCFNGSPSSSEACACSDLNGDGSINLVDFATLSLIFNGVSTNAPPNCP